MTTRSLRFAAAPSALLLACAGILVLTGSPAAAAGTGYFVDGGSAACTDTGTGTQAAPFCTVSAAAKKAINPGDTVHIAPGVYREQVTVAGSGTSTDPISFVGDAPGVVILGTRSLGGAGGWTATSTTAWSTPYAPPSAPRQVFLDGTRLAQAGSATTTTANSWFFDATAKALYVDIGGANPGDGHEVEAGAQSYGVNVAARHDVVVSNLETRRQNFAGVRVQGSTGVTVDGVSASGSASNGILVDTCTGGVVVRNASVSGSLSIGIRLTASSGDTVSGSTSHDNGLHGIALSTSTNNTLDGNTVYRNTVTSGTATANGIDVDTQSPDNTVSDNVAYGNQDSGIQIYNGSHRALVVRNTSYANGDHGFDTLGSTGVRYVNNTSYGNRRDGISVEGSSTGATLTNNLLVDNGSSTKEFDLYVDPGSVSGFTADYDVAYNHDTTPPVKYNGTIYTKLAGFVAASGQEAHGLAEDPDFRDPANGDLRLTPGSAAVDSANAGASGFTGTDPAGNQVTDDPLVPDTGAGTPAYADRGALESLPTPGATDYAPHAALVVDPGTVSVPPSGTVTADASGSNDADVSGIASYTFDFGDGTVVGPQAAATATHAYSKAGSYPVTVTVTDGSGMQDTATAQETVTARAASTYHVEQGSPACSDTGDGSAATPFCTIGAATKKLVAGDTALVGAGQYREQVQLTTGGETGAPITLQATTPSAVILGSNDVSDAAGWSSTGTTAWQHAYAPAAAPTQVWVDGQPLTKAASATQTTTGSWFYDATAATLYVDIGGGNPAVGHTVAAGARNYGLLLRGNGYVDVSGFTVRQTNLAGAYLDTTNHVSLTGLDVGQAGTHGITVDGSTNATLKQITSAGNLSIGVRLSNSSDSSLVGATTHDNQFHGVSVQNSQRVLVSGVTSYGNKKPGTRVAAGIDVSSSSTGTTVQDSTSYGNDDSGIEAYTGATGTVIRRNVIYDNGDHGIDSSGAPGSVVVSNTVVGNATAGINFEGGSSGGTTRDNVTANNAVGSTRTIGEIRVDQSSAPGVDLDRDLVFQSNGGPLFEWNSQPYTTVAGFRTVSAQEPNGIGADPQFAGLAGRDLRLTSGSPAVDAAYTGLPAWVSADHDGTAPIDDPNVANTGSGPDAAADLGALEYAGPAVSLVTGPTTGTAPLTVSVDASGSKALGAPITAYRIDCGNGTVLTSSSGSCSYPSQGTFTIAATVTDATGAADTATAKVTVTPDAAPTATLKATPVQAYVPQQVTLDASGSRDTDNTPIADYRFDCGNGAPTVLQTTATTTCSYTKAGTYTASVTVRDTAGLSTRATTTVKILADVPPTAVLHLTTTQGTVGQKITANGSGSTSVDKSPIATYRFDCGNGQTTQAQTSPSTTCTYTSPGNYTVQMWVTDTVGLVATATQKIHINKK
ncbi:MAG: right-handed parallel beta-helix repeat-containing protein [Nocardioidaceae bacterium]